MHTIITVTTTKVGGTVTVTTAKCSSVLYHYGMSIVLVERKILVLRISTPSSCSTDYAYELARCSSTRSRSSNKRKAECSVRKRLCTGNKTTSDTTIILCLPHALLSGASCLPQAKRFKESYCANS